MSFSTEKKVGLFFLASLIALAVMIEMVEDWNPFEEDVAYHAYFDRLVGLNVGDSVRLAGVKVGKVRGIELSEGRVRVEFTVREETPVQADSLARVRQTNLLGGQYLGLSFGSPDAPQLSAGDRVETAESVSIDELLADVDRDLERVLGSLGDLVETSGEKLGTALAHLESVLNKVDSGEGTFGRLVNDPALYRDFQAVLAELHDVSARLSAGEGTLGRLFTDEQLYEEARGTLANLREISGRIRAGEGSFGKLLASSELHDNAGDALANIRDISRKANEGEGTIGRLLNDETLYTETAQTMASINSIAGKIDRGDGTVGRLINEDDLYRDAKTTLNKVEKTVDGISDSGPLTAMGMVIGTLF